MDLHHVTFIKHLSDQPQVSRTGINANATPCTEEDATASASVPQMASDGTPSLPLVGMAPPLVPTSTRLVEQPRQSTWN